MKSTLSVLVATLFLAGAAAATPTADGSYSSTGGDAKSNYDDGSWHPGKYPGDAPQKSSGGDYGHPSTGYSGGATQHQGSGYGGASNHSASDHDDHSSDNGGYSSGSDNDDHKSTSGYGGQQAASYGTASPYDYAPRGRERSYSRSRERVNQWHDVGSQGYSRSYARNWHGQGQYYLQRRGLETDAPRGRTLVRRSEEPKLQKRGYSWDGYGHYPYYNYGLRPLRPLRPIGGYGYDSDHYLYKRSVNEEQPELEKRGDYDSGSDSDNGYGYNYGYAPRRYRPYGYNYGYHPYGGYHLQKRSVNEEQPELEKRGDYDSGSDSEHSDYDYSGYNNGYAHNNRYRGYGYAPRPYGYGYGYH